MMHAACTLFVMVLFFLLTPGILLSIPQTGSLQQKALVHAVVFGVIFHFFHSVMMRYAVAM